MVKMAKAKIKETKISKEYDKDFIEAFIRQLLLMKERTKIEKEKAKIEEEREKLAKVIAKERAKIKAAKITEIERKLRPSILKTKEREEMRAQLKKISIEKEERKVEKAEIKPPAVTPAEASPLVVAPTIPEIPLPPVYRRGLPSAPMLPKKEVAVPKAPVAPMSQIARTSTLATIIDLGKLNTFVQDAAVTVIQCDGANIPIKIIKEGKVVETIITLTETEIKDVLKRFADRTNQVITEPVFKAQVGNLAFTAIISSFTGSRFIISKI